MQVIISTVFGGLASIFIKILMKAITEKQLASIMFSGLSYFAGKTATDKDDAIVAWAKSMYYDKPELEDEVAKFE